MVDSEWLSPQQILERYVDFAVGDIPQAEAQLYLAIISGEVRARRNGVVFGPEWLEQLRDFRTDESYRSALPPDIELSVEDVERKWSSNRSI
jgi:hypothetical protein